MQSDEQEIRMMLAAWMEATKAGDAGKVLALISDDVVFLRPGHAPMRKADFGAAQSAQASGAAPMKFDATSEIQEIKVLGDWAFMWTQLKVFATPPGDQALVREGHTLSILKKENGKWVLARDANMLAPLPPNS